MMSEELSIKQNRFNGIAVPSIACIHSKDDHVITENYEIVCKRCGVVLGTDNSQEVATESTLNLFHEIEPGTKPVKAEFTKRTHEPKKSDASYFSNTCHKLDLPRHCYLEAWNIYKKLRRNTSCTKAQIASFALFCSCKRYSIPRSEEEIGDAIRMGFKVKRVPTILAAFSKVKLLAEGLGISCSEGSKTEYYYLNLYLARKQQRLGHVVDFDLIRKRAMSLFEAMDGNNETKARRAVKIALGGNGRGIFS